MHFTKPDAISDKWIMREKAKGMFNAWTYAKMGEGAQTHAKLCERKHNCN